MPQRPTSEKRRVGIVVDLNEESMNAIQWAVSKYVCPEDAIILLHVQPTDGLYGADWGDLGRRDDLADVHQHCGKDIVSMLMSSKLVWPLLNAKIPYKIHVVKDYDRKERICLEAERLRLSTLIMGVRCGGERCRAGTDAISDYCMTHCECPVVVVQSEGVGDDGDGKLQSQVATLCLESKI